MVIESEVDLGKRIAKRATPFDVETQDPKQASTDLPCEDQLDSIEHLAISMAHDFNNLLTVLCTNLELVAKHVTHPEASAVIVETLKAVEVGTNLSQRLLTHARKSELPPVKLSTEVFLTETVALLERMHGDDILITTVLDPIVWCVFVDPGEFQSALLNLATNARDAMPGGGNLTMEVCNSVLSTEDSELRAGEKPGEYVVIIVSDTGTGMTEDVMRSALVPFFTTKKIGKGTGLGLSNVNKFVNESGGFLKYYSTVGIGTTVRLYLPRARDQAASDVSADFTL